MDNSNKEYFDLPTLLKQGDFDVRRFANRTGMSTDEYFSLLSGFTSLAYSGDNALRDFIDRAADKESYKQLENVATALKELMCDKYVDSIYSILEAYEKGNWRLASTYAERIRDDYYAFYSRILAAKKKKRQDPLPETTLPLKAFIQWLDDEEANRKMLVLAVDDSPVILSSVSSVLSNDYKVFLLAKPKMLETVLQQMTPELFLLDYLMPDRNGFELIPIIRSFEEHRDTPIIFLTSEGTLDNVTAALALGASDFIVKPFNPDALREKIDKHIVRKKNY